jgi:hypothetical protein
MPNHCILHEDAFAQAWIVAQLLRAAEDLYEIPLSSRVESAAALV